MKPYATILIALFLVVLLPLLGAAAAGQPLAGYLRFPPTTPDLPHATLSLTAFVALALVEAAAIWPFLRRAARTGAVGARRAAGRPFPWWGWAGIAGGAASWFLAWTRLPGMETLQEHTFTPLWLSFILVVNALAARRTGSCPLLDRPRRFLLLFPASAAFWWSFEYLNRFVGNWRYVGVASFGPWEYFLSATLPFSTVLPAVVSVRDLLRSVPRLEGAFRRWRTISPEHPRTAAGAGLAVACAGLLAVGLVPEIVFPLVWLAPPLLLVSLAALRGEEHALSGIAGGDWRPAVAAVLAALVCGFFWEMWNSGSAAKWMYSIPYVDAAHLFEMPVLGYAGYLPFGVLCAEIGDRLLSRDAPAWQKSSSPPGQLR